jgi:outer membrane protein assembly factor BamB
MVAVLQGVPAGMVSRVIVVNGQRIGFTSCWGAGDSSAVVYDGLICLAVGDRLIAVDAETGKEKWTYKPSLKTQQSPDGRRGVIVMRARAARIQAVQVRMLVAGNAGLAGVGSGGLSGAAVVNGVIYFGSREGLHALEKKSRSEIWRFDTPLPVSGRPIVANGVIYFHTTRGMLAGLTRTAPGGRGDLAPQQRAGLYAVRLKAKD